MPQQSNRQSRGWVVPAVVLGLAAVLVAVVFLLRDGPSEQAGTQDLANAPEDQEASGESGDEDAGEADVGAGDQPAGDTGAQDTGAQDPGVQDPGVQGPPAQVEGPEQPEAGAIERRDADDLLAAGPVDAPVVLVVFSDYQCPFCAQWSAETLPVMMEYADAGDLRIEWRDVNIMSDRSEIAARASYAAALQDHFWEYHDELYPGGEIRSHRELTEEGLTEIAEGMGLDGEQFATDLNNPGTAEEIDRNEQLGLDLGAFSTPSFILGGEPIIGAQPTEVFTDAVETALAEEGQ